MSCSWFVVTGALGLVVAATAACAEVTRSGIFTANMMLRRAQTVPPAAWILN